MASIRGFSLFRMKNLFPHPRAVKIENSTLAGKRIAM
jgi:hypothetical protein